MMKLRLTPIRRDAESDALIYLQFDAASVLSQSGARDEEVDDTQCPGGLANEAACFAGPRRSASTAWALTPSAPASAAVASKS